MRKAIVLSVLCLSATAIVAQMATSPMQVDEAGRLVVPNKSAWQDANGIAARDRANTFTGANTFTVLPSLPLVTGRIWVGNATSNAAPVAVSGAITIATNGAVSTVGLSTNIAVIGEGDVTNVLVFTQGRLTAINP